MANIASCFCWNRLCILLRCCSFPWWLDLFAPLPDFLLLSPVVVSVLVEGEHLRSASRPALLANMADASSHNGEEDVPEEVLHQFRSKKPKGTKNFIINCPTAPDWNQRHSHIGTNVLATWPHLPNTLEPTCLDTLEHACLHAFGKTCQSHPHNVLGRCVQVARTLAPKCQ